MTHCKVLIPICSLFLFLQLPIVYAQPTTLIEQCNQIELLEVELRERCFTEVALQTGNSIYCNKIDTPSGISRCKSRILLNKPDYATVFGTKMILVYLGIVLLFSVIFSQERTVYLYGAIMGALLYSVDILLQAAPFEITQTMHLYYTNSITPLKTIATYSPEWFTQTSEIIQMLTASIVVYGQIIANILSRNVGKFVIAVCIALLTVGLHWFPEKIFLYFTTVFSAIGSLFTV